LPDDKRIRYVQMAAGRTIGAKRNYACELAQGEIIAQWDDDDWYAAGRLTAQVAPLLAGKAEISGLMATLFFELSRWRFWSCTPELHKRMFEADVHGGTLVFRRQVWQQLARYPDRSLAEDAYFLRQALRRGARLSRLPNDNLFIYLRHAKNSWAFTCGQFLSPQGWQRRGEPPFSPEECAFYRSHSPAATSSPISLAVGGGGQASSPGQAGSVPTGNGHVGPLVSCIMPTANRRHLVPNAIRYFLQQDYGHRELIIVDDGEDEVGDLVPADGRIRYVRLNKRHTIGAKRNVACEQASGEIVVHWDDDDWFAPWRLTYQVESLVKEGADICGLTTLLYYESAAGQTWRYHYPAGQRAWVTGNTLCYPRGVWKRSPFPNINVGEDTRFVWSGQARHIFALPRHDFYVAMLHASNISVKSCRGPYWSRWEGDLGAIMGDDLRLYQTERVPVVAK
jgi:glycosyltransferase involved in cell wall biosynthesis